MAAQLFNGLRAVRASAAIQDQGMPQRAAGGLVVGLSTCCLAHEAGDVCRVGLGLTQLDQDACGRWLRGRGAG